MLTLWHKKKIYPGRLFKPKLVPVLDEVPADICMFLGADVVNNAWKLSNQLKKRWRHKSEAFKCLITLKCQMWIICDVLCTAIDIILYEHERDVSYIQHI